MSAGIGEREKVPQLQVAAVDKLHLVVDGRALCGRVIVDDRDAYSDQAGLAAWNRGPLDQCARCSAALVSRIRRAADRATATGQR